MTSRLTKLRKQAAKNRDGQMGWAPAKASLPIPLVPASAAPSPLARPCFGNCRRGEDDGRRPADLRPRSNADLRRVIAAGDRSLEAVCRSHAFTHWLAGVRGGRLLVGEQALMHDLARWEQVRDEADEAVRALKHRLRGAKS